jgi:hypothetical protein
MQSGLITDTIHQWIGRGCSCTHFADEIELTRLFSLFFSGVES